MRIGYAKIGRSMPLAPADWGKVGGDNEPPILLNKLARRHPDVEWVFVGRNSGEAPLDVGFTPNVSNPWTELRPYASEIMRGMQSNGKAWARDAWDDLTGYLFDDLDGLIVWAGQHGTSNSPIPDVKNGIITKPQDSFVNYGGYIVRGISRWRTPDPENRWETWLCPDVRNYLKARDLYWPPAPVLSQFDQQRKQKHYRYGDQRDPFGLFAGPDVQARWDVHRTIWEVQHRYRYAQLEIVGIPSSIECNLDWNGRHHFGVLINEARAYVSNSRLQAMHDWIMPLQPAWVRGKWTDKSLAELGVDIQPLEWHAVWDWLRITRATFTTPSSGSGWATTKPWEAFGCGVVCFFHPAYDTQGHVIPTLRQARGRDDDAAQLARWLRVDEPAQLAARVRAVNEDRDTWLWLVTKQRELFDAAQAEQRCVHDIERRLGLCPQQ